MGPHLDRTPEQEYVSVTSRTYVVKFCLLIERPHTGCAELANAGPILVSIVWCNDWLAVLANSSNHGS